MRQLGLPIKLNTTMLLDDFIGEQNQQAITFFNQAIVRDNHCVIYIAGGLSTGKTHLLQGFTSSALEKNIEAIYIDVQQELPYDVFEQISHIECICLDNIESLSDVQQQSLFDLYNQIQHTSIKLVLSSRHLPSELNLLQDLKTRLSLAFLFKLTSLSDVDKITIINRRMQNKNIKIQASVYRYLLSHYSRNLNDIFILIDTLDTHSLEQKQSISIPFVKKILASV